MREARPSRHRAEHPREGWLAEQVFASDSRPILVTTFNSTLAKQLEPMLDELCTGAPSVRARLLVRSTTRVAQEILKDAKRPNMLVTDLDDAWKDALALDEAGRGRRFYESERAHVLARHGAWTEAEYLAAARTGRANRLDRAARKAVWKVLAAFEAALEKAGGGDDIALSRSAEQAVTANRLAPFAAIVCDEAQDLGAADLRLLAALTRDTDSGATRANALTLAGDAYQRLYRAPVPLSACGIDVRGRARNLRLNYRTTEAIRRAAVAVVAGTVPDDADETDTTTLDGYRALRSGAPPVERTFGTPADEASWIAELAAEKRGALLVLSRTHDYLDALKALLVARGATPRVLGANDLPSDKDALVLCTLHRAKGLESPRVVVAGRQLVPQKFPGGDAADRAEWEKKESATLYVGITRARDWCGISTIGG